MKDNNSMRINILIGIVVFVGVAFIAELFSLQVVNGAEYRKQSENRLVREVKVTAPRGDIYDRYGKVIATSETSYSVNLYYTKIEKTELNKGLLRLVNILEKNGDSYNNNFPIDFETMTFKKSEEAAKTWKKVNKIDENATVEEVIEFYKEKYEIENEDIQRSKSEFFANLSHELRTPVNIIFSSLQVLNLKIEAIKDKSQQESISKYTNIAVQNTYRLLKLVNNLIDSNKITSGYFDFKPQSYDLIFFVESICQSIVEFAKTKNIEVIFDTEIEEKVILFDLDKMERIILNILSNAIKFSNDGDKIEIFIKEVNDMIEIKISDSGIGIPKDKIGCIFDRFKQVDNHHVRKGEGSGIGLYLVKSLVDMHNGDISVESELGKGTTFTINIPIKYELEDDSLIIIDKNIQDSHIEKIKVEFSDIYA
jgi:signal transduction histidine kinase